MQPEAFHIIRSTDKSKKPLITIETTTDTDKPTNIPPYTHSEYFLLPDAGTVMEYAPLSDEQQTGWMPKAGIIGSIHLSKPVTRIWQFPESHRHEHRVELTNFPPTGSNDNYWFENEGPGIANLAELVDYCIEQFGWIIGPLLQQQLNTLASND